MSKETTPPDQTQETPPAPPATTPPPAGNPPVGQQDSGKLITLEEHTARVSGLNRKLTDVQAQLKTLQGQVTTVQTTNEQLAGETLTLQQTIQERDEALSSAQQAATDAAQKAHLLNLAAGKHPKLLALLSSGTIAAPTGENDEEILSNMATLEEQLHSAYGSQPVTPVPTPPPVPPAQGTTPSGAPPLSTSQQVDVDALRLEHRQLAANFTDPQDQVDRRMVEIEAQLNALGAAGAR